MITGIKITGITMKFKSGKLFLPFVNIASFCRFCWCCVLYCCWLVIFVVPWYMSVVHFATASCKLTSAVCMYWNVSIYSTLCHNWCRSISICMIHSFRVMYMFIQTFDLPAIAAQSFVDCLRTLPVVLLFCSFTHWLNCTV